MHIYSIDSFAGRLLQAFEELIKICHISLRQIIPEKILEWQVLQRCVRCSVASHCFCLPLPPALSSCTITLKGRSCLLVVVCSHHHETKNQEGPIFILQVKAIQALSSYFMSLLVLNTHWLIHFPKLLYSEGMQNFQKYLNFILYLEDVLPVVFFYLDNQENQEVL